MKHVSIPRSAIAVLVSASLAGCASDKFPLTAPVTVASRDEAAAVLISVNSFAPWDQVADAVQPNFSMANGDVALQQVAPVTLRIEEHALRAFGLSAGIGLPGTSTASSAVRGLTSTQTAANNNGTDTTSGATTSTTTNTTTETRQPGVAPTPPTGIPAGAQAPAAAASVVGDIGIDPILKYQAAMALYQAVQLMNRQVQNVASLGCYVPFMVHTKFAVMPYRRNLPYDLHARVSFFPDEAYLPAEEKPKAGARPLPAAAPRAGKAVKCENRGDMPLVVPLLVTDDIERAMKSRAAETARQLSLAVSAMVHGVGANVGVNSANRDGGAISGSDINSRLTVARQSDNTLYARIGATQQATAGLALVGQTYDVSLLLLVPESYFDSAGKDGVVLHVHTYSEMRNALDGSVLPTRSSSTLAAQAGSAMQETLGADAREAWNRLTPKSQEEIVRRLAAPIQQSDWKGFEDALAAAKLGTADPNDELAKMNMGYKRALWTRLSVLLADSPFKTAFFELPRPAAIEIPAQLALLLDDGKDKAHVRLHNASGAISRGVAASLQLVPMKENVTHNIPAQAVVFDPVTGVLTLEFPSLGKWNLAEFDKTKSRLQLVQRCSGQSLCPEFKGSKSFRLTSAAPAASPDNPSAAFELKANVRQIVARDARGGVSVSLDKIKNETVTVTVLNADISQVTDNTGKAVTLANKNQVSVTQPGTLAFRLLNVRAGNTVTIEAEGKRDGKSTGKKTVDFVVVGG